MGIKGVAEKSDRVTTTRGLEVDVTDREEVASQSSSGVERRPLYGVERRRALVRASNDVEVAASSHAGDVLARSRERS